MIFVCFFVIWSFASFLAYSTYDIMSSRPCFALNWEKKKEEGRVDTSFRLCSFCYTSRNISISTRNVFYRRRPAKFCPKENMPEMPQPLSTEELARLLIEYCNKIIYENITEERVHTNHKLEIIIADLKNKHSDLIQKN